MDESLERIHRLANERHELYKLAGHGTLTHEQKARMSQINFELPGVWDEHRRAFAVRIDHNEVDRAISASAS